MIKNEWKSLWNNKILIIVVMAIIVIPVIYAGLFLKSMWDPYGNLDKLPVAVVNNDKSVEYNGKTLSVGSDMVDELKDNDSLDFHFVDSDEAEQGLKNGTYYMVITIPEDFSSDASTLMDDNPKKMELKYETNPGTNYIASKMSETALSKIREAVASKVTETYTQTVFDQIGTVGDGMQEAADGSTELKDGLTTASDGNKTITTNLKKLADSTLTFRSGAETLTEGLKEYTDGVSQVDSGADQLADGAGQIQDGSSKLYDGSKELGDGITKLEDGSDTLATSLNDGAKEVKETNASDDTISMFATPITDEETKITTVENNGHAMAPYMMSVGLWVGCLAFCLMYPLTEYKGKLKSGFAWWGSKASVLYPVAVLQGVLLILLLHVFDGFTPVEMTKTILFAALTGVCFTSIMYFFNITFGKVGSFLMLIFMVVQLAGSAGTYPVEISPSFVAKIHYYLPFTYTVNAFRSTICGGESIRQAVIVLIGLTLIFSILTILQFNHMARRKKQGKLVLLDWLEEKGVA